MQAAKAMNVHVRRVDNARGGAGDIPDLEADLGRARWLANLLDARFSIAGIPFGLDAIIGLIPGVGDTITALIALYPIYLAERHKLGRALQARMAFNVFVDWLPGMIPLVGDVIDVLYKANLKNLKLLEQAAEKHRVRGGA